MQIIWRTTPATAAAAHPDGLGGPGLPSLLLNAGELEGELGAAAPGVKDTIAGEGASVVLVLQVPCSRNLPAITVQRNPAGAVQVVLGTL